MKSKQKMWLKNFQTFLPSNSFSMLIKISILFVCLQRLNANPTVRDQEEYELMVDPNESVSNLNFQIRRNRPPSVGDDLDSNSDDVRLHKHHHHHHFGHHQSNSSDEQPIRISSTSEFGKNHISLKPV